MSAVLDINAVEPAVPRTERKRHRKSLQLRQLAQSYEKNGANHSAASAPITPLALHSEMAVISPRTPENEAADAATVSTGGGKLLLAVSWPGIASMGGKGVIVSPLSREMSPRELNRKLAAALVEKSLKGTVTTITRDLNDLVDEDDDGSVVVDTPQQPKHAVRTTGLPLESRNSLGASRARSTLAHRSLPVFNRATPSVALPIGGAVDMRKCTFDERTHDDIRRVSSSSATTTTTSSSTDASSTASAEKKNGMTFVLDRSLDDDEYSSTAANGASASEEVRPSDDSMSKTLPRRKSERFFAEFKQLVIPTTTMMSPTASPHSSPRARSSTILDNTSGLVHVNSYSHSMDHSPLTARHSVTRIIRRTRDTSRDKTLIQLFVDPVDDKLASYVVPNTLINGKLRNTLTRAAMSNVESRFRTFVCTHLCVKTEGTCLAHLIDPDAAAKFPVVFLLDRRSVPGDYRQPHLLAMFQKDFPMLMGDEWSRFKTAGVCTDFSAERISHVYCIRVYC